MIKHFESSDSSVAYFYSYKIGEYTFNNTHSYKISDHRKIVWKINEKGQLISKIDARSLDHKNWSKIMKNLSQKVYDMTDKGQLIKKIMNIE